MFGNNQIVRISLIILILASLVQVTNDDFDFDIVSTYDNVNSITEAKNMAIDMAIPKTLIMTYTQSTLMKNHTATSLRSGISFKIKKKS